MQTAAPFHSPTDRLSTLCSELLTDIFDRVQSAEERPTHGAVSKALLPYTYRSLYHKVRINELASLKLFVRTLGSSGSLKSFGGGSSEGQKDPLATQVHPGYLASLVKHLHVSVTFDEQESWPAFNSDMVDLFNSLTCLRKLTLAWCPEVIGIFTTDHPEGPPIPSLKVLKLQGLVLEGFDIFKMKYFQNLRRLAQLEMLELHFFSRDRTDGEDLLDITNLSARAKLPAGFALSIRNLHLEVDQSTVTSKTLATFLSYFRNLEVLYIMDYVVFLYFDTVLAKVSPTLKELTIDRSDHTDGDLPFGEVLSRFPHLLQLTLGYDTYTNDTFLAVRNLVGLEKLSILNAAVLRRVPWNALHELLRHTPTLSLKEISIHVHGIEAKEGPSLTLLKEVPHYSFQCGWRIPGEFGYREWDSDQVQGFIEAAAQAGIKFTGILVDALLVERKWNKEIAELKLRLEAEEREGEGTIGATVAVG